MKLRRIVYVQKSAANCSRINTIQICSLFYFEFFSRAYIIIIYRYFVYLPQTWSTTTKNFFFTTIKNEWMNNMQKRETQLWNECFTIKTNQIIFFSLFSSIYLGSTLLKETSCLCKPRNCIQITYSELFVLQAI